MIENKNCQFVFILMCKVIRKWQQYFVFTRMLFLFFFFITLSIYIMYVYCIHVHIFYVFDYLIFYMYRIIVTNLQCLLPYKT